MPDQTCGVFFQTKPISLFLPIPKLNGKKYITSLKHNSNDPQFKQQRVASKNSSYKAGRSLESHITRNSDMKLFPTQGAMPTAFILFPSYIFFQQVSFVPAQFLPTVQKKQTRLCDSNCPLQSYVSNQIVLILPASMQDGNQ